MVILITATILSMKLYSKLARSVGVLALGLVLLGGSFTFAPRAYAADGVFPCTIETSDGTIYPGTWINGVCQPNNPLPASGSGFVVVNPVGFFDQLKLWFTFSPEKKADLLQNFSNRNFELAKQTLISGDIQKASTLFSESEKNNKKASEVISKISDEAKKHKALASLSAATLNQSAVLTAVQVKLENPTAKAAIQNVLDKQSEIKSSLDEKLKDTQNTSPTKTDPVSTPSSAATRPATGATIAKCLPTSTPSITVLSPNGGEVYTAGQQMIVKWESCNISSNDQVFIQLAQGASSEGPEVIEGIPYYSQNDNQETITIATSDFSFNRNNFRIQVTLNSDQNIFDYSDNYFKIAE